MIRWSACASQTRTQGSRFLKKNSLGQVPVLELDDGTCLSESLAICRYLEELNPTPALFGKDAVSRAQTEMWIGGRNSGCGTRWASLDQRRCAHCRGQSEPVQGVWRAQPEGRRRRHALVRPRTAGRPGSSPATPIRWPISCFSAASISRNSSRWICRKRRNICAAGMGGFRPGRARTRRPSFAAYRGRSPMIVTRSILRTAGK